MRARSRGDASQSQPRLSAEGDARAPEGQAADYTDFLADQVLPQLRSRYRVASGPGTTAIVGSSNGAIHALFAGLHRPETLVGRVPVLRALQPEQNFMALERLTEVPLQRVYLDSGTRWGEHDPDGVRRSCARHCQAAGGAAATRSCAGAEPAIPPGLW